MKRYRIYSEAGVDHGTWQGHDEAEALGVMHRETGYDLYADNWIIEAEVDTERGNSERRSDDAKDAGSER